MCGFDTRTVHIVKSTEQCQGGTTTLLQALLDPAKAEALRAKLADTDAGGSNLYEVESMDIVY